MQSQLILQAGLKGPVTGVTILHRWQRVLLLSVLGYESSGALTGGILLMIEPDGRLMKMPVEMMHSAFPDFMIPGIILSALGLINALAFFLLLYKRPLAWIYSLVALIGLLIWFWIEIAILLELHWLHIMWGLPVVVGLVAGIAMMPKIIVQKSLLYCGIVSSLLYIAINMIVSSQWEAYNTKSQTISELSAIGAPTRFLWTVMALPYTFLVLAFGWGVYQVSGTIKRLRIAGILLLIYGATGFLWPFVPMHLRETLAQGGGTVSDTLHLVLGAVTVIIYLLTLGFAGSSLGKPFRIYSIITLILLVLFGILTFNASTGIVKNEPTPLIGTWERLNIGLFLVWIVVLAIILLQRYKRQVTTGQYSARHS